MPMYDNTDRRYNPEELDPCLAAEIRIKNDLLDIRQSKCLLCFILALLTVLLLTAAFVMLFYSSIFSNISPRVHYIEKDEDYELSNNPSVVNIQHSQSELSDSDSKDVFRSNIYFAKGSANSKLVENVTTQYRYFPASKSAITKSPMILSSLINASPIPIIADTTSTDTTSTSTTTISTTTTSTSSTTETTTQDYSTVQPFRNKTFTWWKVTVTVTEPTSTTTEIPLTTTTVWLSTTTVASTDDFLNSSVDLGKVKVEAPNSVASNISLLPKAKELLVEDDSLRWFEHINTSETMKDCEHYRLAGYNKSGVYNIALPGLKNFYVFCFMNEDHGWMMLHRRTGPELSFWNVTFDDYADGFGDPRGDHWLGLDKVYDYIRRYHSLQMRIILRGNACSKPFKGCNDTEKRGYWWGDWDFSIANRHNFYNLTHIRYLRGNLSDPSHEYFSLINRNQKFTTVDRDNDANVSKNLAMVREKGGWWHKDFTFTSPNGAYGGKANEGQSWYWSDGKSETYYIKPKVSLIMFRIAD